MSVEGTAQVCDLISARGSSLGRLLPYYASESVSKRLGVCVYLKLGNHEQISPCLRTAKSQRRNALCVEPLSHFLQVHRPFRGVQLDLDYWHWNPRFRGVCDT